MPTLHSVECSAIVARPISSQAAPLLLLRKVRVELLLLDEVLLLVTV